MSDADLHAALEALADQEGFQALAASWQRSREAAHERVVSQHVTPQEREVAAAEYRAYHSVVTLRERVMRDLERKMNSNTGGDNGNQ